MGNTGKIKFISYGDNDFPIPSFEGTFSEVQIKLQDLVNQVPTNSGRVRSVTFADNGLVTVRRMKMYRDTKTVRLGYYSFEIPSGIVDKITVLGYAVSDRYNSMSRYVKSQISKAIHYLKFSYVKGELTEDEIDKRILSVNEKRAEQNAVFKKNFNEAVEAFGIPEYKIK